jgi:hypothetical protein
LSCFSSSSLLTTCFQLGGSAAVGFFVKKNLYAMQERPMQMKMGPVVLVMMEPKKARGGEEAVAAAEAEVAAAAAVAAVAEAALAAALATAEGVGLGSAARLVGLPGGRRLTR